MDIFMATTSEWFLIGPIAKALGWIMNWIFEGLSLIGLPNIGLAIIIFTIVVKALMIPLSIRQQKFTKLQSIMSPELTAIQNKYKGKKDNDSLMSQQAEMKDLYEKYGTSPTGGCLQLLIQMPILFALYQVIYHLPGHITILKDYYAGVADKVMGIERFFENTTFTQWITDNKVIATVTNMNPAVSGAEEAKNYVIDMLYTFTPEKWQGFINNVFPNAGIGEAYSSVAEKITSANSFIGIDLTMDPMSQLTQGVWWVLFIPILAGLLQWLSSKLATVSNPAGKDAPGNSTMKTMNIMFPLMSVVFCFMFSAGIGVYWVASSGVQVLVQLLVNSYMNKVDINEMVTRNIEKANEKRVKKGLPPKKVTTVTNVVHNLEETKRYEDNLKKTIAEESEASSNYYASTTTARKGSLAEKAGMVQQYEERQKELRARGGNKN